MFLLSRTPSLNLSQQTVRDMLGQILISMGHNAEFGIDEENQFFIQKTQNGEVTSKIILGPATERQLDIMILNMGRFRIHTERN